MTTKDTSNTPISRRALVLAVIILLTSLLYEINIRNLLKTATFEANNRWSKRPWLKCDVSAEDSVHSPLGRHYMVDLYGVSRENIEMLESSSVLGSISNYIAKADLTLLDYSSHHFECGGITAVFLLSESHVSLHSWPEHGFVALDVYTCGKGRPEYIVDQFKKLLKPTRSHQTFLERGAQHVVREQSHNTLSETSQESGIPAELQNATVIESDSALSEVLNTTNICVNADDDEDDCYLLRNAEVLVDERSQYQRIEVVDTQNWGRCMLLDRVVQFCESDNAIYTREMVNKAMSSLENPAGPLNITIVGGGDGWIASYLLDHYESRIHQIQIVDIDQKVAEITQKYFRPEGVHDSFTDSRVHWTFADAGKWLREHPTAASTSLVIIDCTDHTIESSKVLYTTQFYQDVHSLLTPGGYVVQQMNTEVEEYSEFFGTLAKDWKLIGLNGLRQWSEYVPSFGGKSLFWLAQKK